MDVSDPDGAPPEVSALDRWLEGRMQGVLRRIERQENRIEILTAVIFGLVILVLAIMRCYEPRHP